MAHFRAFVRGARKLFTYPNYGTPDGYPEYTAHSGQIVTVLGSVPPEEQDDEVGAIDPLYRVRADDGWEGVVYESELSDAS